MFFREEDHGEQHQDGGDDADEPVVGNAGPQDLGGVLEPGRSLDEHRIGAPDAIEEGHRGEREAHRDEELLDVPLVQPADQHELGEGGKGGTGSGPHQQGEQEHPPVVRAGAAGDFPAGEGPEGQERAVRKIEHTQSAASSMGWTPEISDATSTEPSTSRSRKQARLRRSVQRT